jgi:fluoride exporter
MLERLLLVGGGAFVGAVARYLIGLWAAERFETSFPVGTLLVNVSGSFLLAFLAVYTTERLELGPGIRLLLGTGLCGGYTTFSTFAAETLLLIEAGHHLSAAAYVVASVALSLLGALLGFWLARLV